jgi:hypothetical protein
VRHLVLAILNTLTVPMNLWTAYHSDWFFLIAMAVTLIAFNGFIAALYWSKWISDRRAN